jgi:hypothetical protein
MNLPMEWACSVCGVTEDVTLYDERLRNPGFAIAPINPTCRECGSSVKRAATKTSSGKNRILLLTGPLGSGKTTIAEHLFTKCGFHAIDHDCLIDLATHLHRRKVEYNSPEVMQALEGNLELLASLDRNIVLSLVILPIDLDIYRSMFSKLGLRHLTVYLCPDYVTVLKRAQTRTCFETVTPEKWVRYFYDETRSFTEMDKSDVALVDNSEISIEETVQIILARFCR